MISSDYFIKKHLLKATNDPHFTYHHLFIGKFGCLFFDVCSVHSLLNEPEIEPVQISSPERKFWTNVVGYCNGLVCLETYI